MVARGEEEKEGRGKWEGESGKVGKKDEKRKQSLKREQQVHYNSIITQVIYYGGYQSAH